MKINDTIIYDSLKKFFGFNEFKGLQKQVINNICEDKNTFVVMPTGGGKSLCYQLPALVKKGTAVVVSPLIALMKNQVDQIRGYSDIEGIAHVLNIHFLFVDKINTFFFPTFRYVIHNLI